MNINLEVIPEKSYAGALAEEIVTVLGYAIEEKGYATFSLSGGSTPGKVYRRLSRPPFDKRIDWKKVYFIFGDERFVPKNDSNSNFRMVKETLLSSLEVDENKILGIDTSLSSCSDAAKNYDKLLKDSLDGKLKLDLVLLGLGTDGHTASIFPNSPFADKTLISEDLKTTPLVKECINPSDNSKRITLLPNILFSSNQVFFLVTGQGKNEILKEIAKGNKKVSEIPAKLSFDATAKVTWFADSVAAKDLD